MSIKDNFPTIKPSLNLDFANTKVLDPRITFSRPTSAVYYDGQTVSLAEQNLVLQSQTFDVSWLVSGASRTANSTTAPDGTNTADKLIEDSSTAVHAVYQAKTVIATTHTASVYMKASERSWGFLQFSTGQLGAYFDLTGGVVGTVSAGFTASIQSVNDGWYRCSITTTTTSASWTFAVLTATGDGVISYTGNGTSGLYIWGAQLEQRDTVTAYTPTTTQPITNYIPTLLTAPANSARFDHNPVTGESLGLLVEEQRTNLVVRSEEFDNVAWSKNNSTVQSNVIVAPDGSLTAEKVIASIGVNFHSVIQNPSITPSTVYTLSCFLKRGEYQYGFLYSDGATKGAIFDLDNLTVTGSILGVPTSSTIVDAGNGWAKCSITVTSGVSTFSNIWVGPTSLPTSANINGDGYSGIYIWGAQLEAGSFPTSYIKTEASQVTRSADSASMTGANFSDWYRQDEGSFYAEAMTASNASSDQIIFGIIGTSLTNGVYIVRQSQAASGTVYGICNDAGLQVALLNLGTPSASTEIKTIMAYKTNDFAGSLNSATVVTDTSGRVSQGVTVAYIGSSGIDQYINSTIKRIAYYPKRLSNENLQALTS